MSKKRREEVKRRTMLLQERARRLQAEADSCPAPPPIDDTARAVRDFPSVDCERLTVDELVYRGIALASELKAVTAELQWRRMEKERANEE